MIQVNETLRGAETPARQEIMRSNLENTLYSKRVTTQVYTIQDNVRGVYLVSVNLENELWDQSHNE